MLRIFRSACKGRLERVTAEALNVKKRTFRSASSCSMRRAPRRCGALICLLFDYGDRQHTGVPQDALVEMVQEALALQPLNCGPRM